MLRTKQAFELTKIKFHKAELRTAALFDMCVSARRRSTAWNTRNGHAGPDRVAGKCRQKAVLPSRDVAVAEPPCATMIALVMAKPKPVPSESGCPRDLSTR